MEVDLDELDEQLKNPFTEKRLTVAGYLKIRLALAELRMARKTIKRFQGVVEDLMKPEVST